jgi:hypothetical protein
MAVLAEVVAAPQHPWDLGVDVNVIIMPPCTFSIHGESLLILYTGSEKLPYIDFG